MFIDLTKVFASVNHKLQWKILSEAGCPDKFIKIIRLLYDDMMATVIANCNSINLFNVKSVVKQGCIAVPNVFLILIAAILEIMDDQLTPQNIPHLQNEWWNL